MATLTQTSLAEYLGATYRPDCEYIDGEIRERNVGKWQHARLQWLLAGWFMNHELEWNVTGSTEQRTQVSATRVLIADVAVLRPGPQPDILTEPPLLVIEILSPDDTYSDLQERCQDYRAMGVENIWIVERLEVPATAIYVNLNDLFRQIDSAAG
jgi:Uma2 family endonuclease